MSDTVTELVREVLAEAFELPWYEREAYIGEAAAGLETVENQAHAVLRRYQKRRIVIEEMSQLRFSTLTLRWRHEATYDSRGVEYLDFTIDGRSLKDILETDHHPWLGRATRESLREFWDAVLLLAKPRFAFGRVPLYLCKICGDPGCGADTVRIQRTRDSFFWSAFGEETPWQAPWYRREVEPFRFHRRQYFDCLERGLAEAIAREG